MPRLGVASRRRRVSLPFWFFVFRVASEMGSARAPQQPASQACYIPEASRRVTSGWDIRGQDGWSSVRIKRLDILRCAAVLLVLFHHTAVLPSISQMGFVGVDLFFVLSGFLISGLLYEEYHKRGSISFPRFFIRRGLKIYPAFYVMLLVTFIVQLAAGKLSGWGAYLREILFIQDYKPGIWTHCWSLGVEEHFYILLPILLLFLIRVSSSSPNPFRVIPRVFLVVGVVCLALRAATVHFTPAASYYGDTITMPT